MGEERVSVATFDGEVPLGELPDVGSVPSRMTGLVIRAERFGDPSHAFQVETGLDVPPLGRREVLIGVKAAGVNYNNVWAARGYPIDVIAARRRQGDLEDFHIGGSDASGVVYAVGADVTSAAVGDEVIVHPGYWDDEDPWVAAGKDPMIAPSAQIWGYNTNFGSFAQFARVQEHQVLAKADHLSWAEAAAPTLVGTTAYRMLHGWSGHTVQPDDLVLVWGGSGGLGTQAIQLADRAGARAIAVVSDDERGHHAQSSVRSVTSTAETSTIGAYLHSWTTPRAKRPGLPRPAASESAFGRSLASARTPPSSSSTLAAPPSRRASSCANPEAWSSSALAPRATTRWSIFGTTGPARSASRAATESTMCRLASTTTSCEPVRSIPSRQGRGVRGASGRALGHGARRGSLRQRRGTGRSTRRT